MNRFKALLLESKVKITKESKTNVMGLPSSATKKASSLEAKEIALLKLESIIPPNTMASVMGATE
jgi:hypothetical protein